MIISKVPSTVGAIFHSSIVQLWIDLEIVAKRIYLSLNLTVSRPHVDIMCVFLNNVVLINDKHNHQKVFMHNSNYCVISTV